MEDKIKKIMERLNFTEKMLDMLPLPIFYKDIDLRYKYFNKEFEAFAGLSYDAIYNKTALDISHPDRGEIYEAMDRKVIAEKRMHMKEMAFTLADGRSHAVELTKIPDLDGAGNVLGVLTLMQDIQEKKMGESRAVLADRMKETLIRLNNNIINYKDEYDFLMDVLEQFQELFGHSQRSSILQIDEKGMVRIIASRGYDQEDTTRFLIPVEETFIYLENQGHLWSACIINDLSKYFHAQVLPADETAEDKFIKSSLEIPILIDEEVHYIICIDSTDVAVFDDNDLFVANYIRSQFQILFRVFRLYQDTLYMSRYDVMTGLMNRRYFDNTLETLITDPEEYGSDYYLVIFDLDHLKKVNDAYGHDAGDTYIQQLGVFLKQELKGAKAIGRIGGDEFAAVLEGEDENVLTRNIEAMKQAFTWQQPESGQDALVGGFSYGIQKYRWPDMTMKQLLRGADEAMYKNKKKYR